MSSPYTIERWYWRVGDSSPGTQVFSSASGSFVLLADATYVAWLSEMGGNSPTDIATLAGLYEVFNTFNSTIVRSSYQTLSISADTTLTNPLPSLLVITPTTDNLKVILPVANKPFSLALGQTFRIRNGASFGIRPFFVYYNDGITKAWITASGAGAITGTEDIIFTSFNNTTANGQVIGASYLSISGGTVKGDLICGQNTSLTIFGPSATLAMRKDPGSYTAIVGVNNSTGKVRWMMKLGDSTAEGGSNTGSDFALERHDDASTGTALGTPLTINRASGAFTLAGDVTVNRASPSVYLQKTGSGQSSAFYSMNGAALRWAMAIGNATAEGGSDAGSDFSVSRYNDAGTIFSGSPFTIKRATGAVAAQGTTTNDNANAGFYGESIESSIANASKISLTTGTPANVTSISLTAGDWDVSGMVQFDGGGTTTITALQAGINTTTASLGFTQGRYAALAGSGLAGGLAFLPTLTIMPTRFSLASTTTVFLVAQATFGTSTCQAYGRISARRMR